MLIGKLIKPCKICLYETRKDGGEIESFSLLKLSTLNAISEKPVNTKALLSTKSLFTLKPLPIAFILSTQSLISSLASKLSHCAVAIESNKSE